MLKVFQHQKGCKWDYLAMKQTLNFVVK